MISSTLIGRPWPSLKEKKLLFNLLPFVLLVHCIEEWFFGFPEWAVRHFGSITTRCFYIMSHIPLLLMVIISSWVAISWWSEVITRILFIAIQITLFTNGIFHLLTTFKFREYSPGIITTIFCTFPFSYFFYEQILKDGQTSIGEFFIAVIIGAITSTLIVFSLYWRKII